MATRSGISQIRRGNSAPSAGNFSLKISELGDNMLVGRVTDVCLNTNSEMFKTSGEYFGIGSIQWEDIRISTGESTTKSSKGLATPLQPFIKEFPLQNEYVLLFKGPSTKDPGVSTDPIYYYVSLKLWNDNEQNASPDPLRDINNSSPQNNKTYSEIEAGVNMEAPNLPTPLKLNGTSGGNFVEDGGIKAVMPFAGDRILEGRFGNSIRLGATAKTEGDITNNWSKSGKEGNAITILKNGQNASITGPGFIPTTEDINVDPSSIYLTSNQQIPILVSTTKVKSGEGITVPFSRMIKKTPISPTSYNNPQIILNSNRLLLNSSEDSIILSSAKSTLLDSNSDSAIRSKKGNVNILAPEGKVSLGKPNARESVILGSSFMEKFDLFLGSYGQLLQTLSKEPSLSIAASFSLVSYDVQIKTLREEMKRMLSRRVKVS
jgi:hypothetical protein